MRHIFRNAGSGPRLLLGEDTVGLEHAGRQVKVGGYTPREQ